VEPGQLSSGEQRQARLASHGASQRHFLGGGAQARVVATGLAYLAELDRPERERRAQSSAAAHPDLPLASAAELHAILDRFAKQGYATADQSYQAGIRGSSCRSATPPAASSVRSR
jgi:DNA-binding IclR family transcriptional regulator